MKNCLGFLLILLASISMAEQKASDLTEDILNQPVETKSVEELLAEDESFIPSMDPEKHDEQMELLQMQEAYIRAMLGRNTAVKELRELYMQEGLLHVAPDAVSASLLGPDSFYPDSGGLNFSDRGIGAFEVGPSGSEVNEPKNLRLAALSYTFEFGTEKQAKVRWDPIAPLVSKGDLLPGGFRVVDVRKDELIIEKDSIVISLNTEPVSIDALLEAVAINREESEGK